MYFQKNYFVLKRHGYPKIKTALWKVVHSGISTPRLGCEPISILNLFPIKYDDLRTPCLFLIYLKKASFPCNSFSMVPFRGKLTSSHGQISDLDGKLGLFQLCQDLNLRVTVRDGKYFMFITAKSSPDLFQH